MEDTVTRAKDLEESTTVLEDELAKVISILQERAESSAAATLAHSDVVLRAGSAVKEAVKSVEIHSMEMLLKASELKNMLQQLTQVARAAEKLRRDLFYLEIEAGKLRTKSVQKLARYASAKSARSVRAETSAPQEMVEMEQSPRKEETKTMDNDNDRGHKEEDEEKIVEDNQRIEEDDEKKKVTLVEKADKDGIVSENDKIITEKKDEGIEEKKEAGISENDEGEVGDEEDNERHGIIDDNDNDNGEKKDEKAVEKGNTAKETVEGMEEKDDTIGVEKNGVVEEKEEEERGEKETTEPEIKNAEPLKQEGAIVAADGAEKQA